MNGLKPHRTLRGLVMMMIPMIILIGSACLAMASGGEEGHEAFAPIFSMDMLWRVINFSVLFGFIYKVTAGPVRTFMSTRRGQIQSALEQARKSKEEAESKYREITQRLGNRDKEFEEIRMTAVENAEKLKERIIADSHEMAIRMEEKARESIQQEIKKAREILKREAAERALKLSEEKLIKEITPGDQKRFVTGYIAGVKR